MCGLYGESPQLIPYSKMQAYKRPAETLPRVKGTHEQDWIRAIKEGGRACADFDYSGPFTEVVLLGNIAKRMNTRLYWDPENMKFTNSEEANKYVGREYRGGWSL